MVSLSLTLVGLALADLVRGSARAPSLLRAALAAGAGVAAAYALAEAGGATTGEALTLAAWVLLVVVVWLAFDIDGRVASGPGVQLAWLGVALAVALAATGIADPVSGRLKSWYDDLPFQAAKDTSADVALLAFGATLFLLATANRVVRLVLAAAGTLRLEATPKLRGGRLLGPLERLIVFGVLLAGEPTAAAIIITAKGLLRLPEIRERPEAEEDSVAEYLLIGTFASLLLAAGAAALLVATR